MQSMTGFGIGTAGSEGRSVSAEVRTLNNRFLDIKLSLPPALRLAEPDLRRLVKKHLARGRVEAFLKLEDENPPAPRINLPVAKAYLAGLLELKTALNLDGEIALDTLLAQPGVLETPEEIPVEAEPIRTLCLEAMEIALTRAQQSRRQEGKGLAEEMARYFENIGERLQTIEKRAPERAYAYREQLQTRIEELLSEFQVDEERLYTEAAFYAERIDITEELVRACSHLGLLKSLLTSEGPVGRKIEFTLQELLREVNTVGAKCNDAKISHLVVDIKENLDKLREQAQNIE